MKLKVFLFIFVLTQECFARQISRNTKPAEDGEFHSRVRRAASKYRKRWNMNRDDEGNFIVPIVFLNVTDKVKERVGEVNKSLTEHTCVRLWPRTDQRTFIRIGSFGGCRSLVGRQNSNKSQMLSLGPRCGGFNTVMHEIMHALGFYHEHSRPDRDDHITVNVHNIKEDQQKYYKKKDEDDIDSFGSQFDINSVMLYPPFGNAIDRNIPTIANKTDGLPLHNNQHWTKEDIRQINAMYECENKHKFCRSLPTIVGSAEIQQENGRTLAIAEYRRTFNHGEVLRVFKCPKWHVPLNNVIEAVCMDGKFSHDVIGCQKEKFCTKEDLPPVIGKGKIRQAKSFNKIGTVIRVSCHYEYSPSGSQTATCTENGFNVSSFVCVKDPKNCKDWSVTCKKLKSEGKCRTDLKAQNKCKKTCGLCTYY